MENTDIRTDMNITKRLQTNYLIKRISTAVLMLALFMLNSVTHAAPKVFTAQVNESVILERLYEIRDIHFTITKAETDDSFLVGGTITGAAGLDAVTGRVIVEINELSKAGMAMKAVGYVEDADKEKGINACTLWQTRMFEDAKLCYAAEVPQGKEYKIVLSVETENVLPPVAGQ